MELLKDTKMEVAWLVWEPRRHEPGLTVVVKATYDLPIEGACALADAQRLPTGDEHAEDDVDRGLAWGSDMEPLKPRGEYWVVGSVHAPSPVSQTMAIAKVGAAEKSVIVTGDRAWRVGRPSEAQPFTKMPIGWERSFGGPGHDENPVGRGLAVDATAGHLMLPNFEDPRATIASGVDRPRTYGLSPRTRSWSARIRHAGTYDARWLEGRYPGFAEDLDYRLFLAAPQDQWIEGFFRGDEAIELASLHPQFPRVKAHLPGHAAQAFTVNARGELTDVGLRLDTIAIDADAGQVMCVWRGLTSLGRGDPALALQPVKHLFVVHQEPPARHSMADYKAWYERTLAREDADASAASAETPPSPSAAAARASAASGASPDAGAVAEEIARRMREAGSDTKAEQVVVLDGEAPGAKWAHLDQAMTVRGDDAPLAASVAQEISRRREEEKSRAFRPVFDDALGLKAPPEVPELSPEEQLELEMQLALGDLEKPESEERDRVRQAIVNGESCEGWELAGVDLSGLDLSGGDFRGAILTRANLSGVHVRGARFDGASLAECELSDAAFDDVSFTRAILSPVRGERVRFVGCRFNGATAGESYFRNARFMRSSLEGSDWTRSDLTDAFFDECSLDGADLSETTLEQARFTRSSLVDAWLEGAKAARAVFDGCDCTLLRGSDGAVFEGASFRRAKLDGARFTRSKLRAANFSLATLKRADFCDAVLAQAQLVGCVLREARLSKAVLVQASLLRSDLHQAQLDGANLKHADLRGANLFQAELLGAELKDARFDLADFTGTRLS